MVPRKLSEEHKRKLHEAASKRTVSEETRKKLSVSTRASWKRGEHEGKPLSEESKQRISEKNKRNWERRLIEGYKQSPEHVAKRLASASATREKKKLEKSS